MTVAIDSDSARDAAERELAKPIYPKDSWTDQIWEWIDDMLTDLLDRSSHIPGGWFTITILLLLLAGIIALAVRAASNTMRTNRGAEPSLFGATELSAAQYRATAEQLAASGNWAAAIRNRLRAIARHLEETGALQAVPGRTATELAHDATELMPDLGPEFQTSTTIFNDVTYGEQPGTENGYRTVAALDTHLVSRPQGRAAVTAGPRDQWTRVS